jgi:hypothetical protein
MVLRKWYYVKCLNEMGFTGDIMGVRDGIKKVVLRTIEDFASKKLRIS